MNHFPLSYFVPGIPAPKGSMKAFVPRGWKRAVITHDNARSKPWASVVSLATAAAVTEQLWNVTEKPVVVTLYFSLPHPAGHYGTGKNAQTLRLHAPNHHTTKPDLDKLTRLVGDALKGLVYRDDSQVVAWHVSKRYADKPGVEVKVEVLL